MSAKTEQTQITFSQSTPPPNNNMLNLSQTVSIFLISTLGQAIQLEQADNANDLNSFADLLAEFKQDLSDRIEQFCQDSDS